MAHNMDRLSEMDVLALMISIGRTMDDAPDLSAKAERFVDIFADNHWARSRMVEHAKVMLTGNGEPEAIEASTRICGLLGHEETGLYCFATYCAAAGRGAIHPNVHSAVLNRTWTGGKYNCPLFNMGLRYKTIAGMFDIAVPEHLMADGERDTLANLPDEFTIYRGSFTTRPGAVRYGMAWSLDCDVAEFFSQDTFFSRDPDSRQNPILLEGVVTKGDVLAYFDDRDEQEVVVRSGRVRRVRHIPIPEMRRVS